MESINKITCPNCGHQFNTEQALAHEVEHKLRNEFNQKFKGLSAQKEQEMQQKLAEALKLQSEKQKNIELELKKRVQEEFETQLKNSQEELEKKRKEVFELKNKELELLKKEQFLKEQQQTLELETQKKLIEERSKIEEAARKKAEEQMQLSFKEKELKLEQLKEQIEVMKKKAEQGSMQAQGEVQELILEEMLKANFPFDLISEVAKGVKGADVIQTVRNMVGKTCGSIIYESKRTKAFSNEWIEKLKSDLRTQKADIAIIVTETMPKEMEKFGQRDGIWICTFTEVQGVASVLRESLIRIFEVKSAQENKGDKMQMLYDFLTGNEFKQHMEAIVEGFSSMQNGLEKEKIQMQKIWNEREQQIKKVLLNTSGMWGSIKGIAGSSISEIKLLELGES
jgi:hypothetical protein